MRIPKAPCQSRADSSIQMARRTSVVIAGAALIVALMACAFLTLAAVVGRTGSAPTPTQEGVPKSSPNDVHALLSLSAAVNSSEVPSGNHSNHTGNEASATDASETCPACAPKSVGRLDLVIPFFERDLCKLKYTAKSISVNDPNHFFGDVYLVWVSLLSSEEYEDDLKEAVASLQTTHVVHMIDFSTQITTSAHLTGWFGQQLVKLKIASVVKSEYYVVMDAKNTLIKPFHSDMFFDKCNRAKIQAQFRYDKIPKPHIDWYRMSADALGVGKPDEGYWPASITPVLFHRQTVLSMLDHIGENSSINALCNGPLCRMLGTRTMSGHGATEFTLYTLYAYKRAELQCIHHIQKLLHFTVGYGDDWQGNLYYQLGQAGFSPSLTENISIGDSDGFPVMWHPGSPHGVPMQSQFPLKLDDLTQRWAASLWRGVKGNREQLSAINIETLEDINSGFRQFPIMFGAQPASLSGMDEDRQEQAIDQIVKLYQAANLYDADTENSTELINCVVGWKND
jgi:hypothetical protein